ncbi:MAG: hypothetical protein IJ697_07570 [Synergistaceae bacterium]|nr:hypothetical protein [Synergistaceae bacterium]
MKKNVFIFLLVIAVFSVAFCISVPEVRAEDEAEARMLKDLLRYISSSEMMYSDFLWALDYIDKFDREKSWESLQLARASISIATLHIEKHKFPALEMTADDERKFMKQGIDVTFLTDADSVFKAEQTALKNTCINLNNSTMYEIFFKEDWEICMRNAANRRKEMEYDLQYLANMADWVLTSLNNPATTKRFNSFLEKLSPKTHARQRKKNATLKNIEADANTLSKKIEELVADDNKIVGAESNRLNIMKYALEKKDLKLIGTPMKISNMPPLIHRPKWFNNKDRNIYYFWKDSNGKSNIPDTCTKLERVPDSCQIRINNVSLSQVKDYQKELEDEGLRCYGSKDEGKKLTLLYKVKGGRFSIIWENEKVIIHMNEDPVCFIPIMYLYLMR